MAVKFINNKTPFMHNLKGWLFVLEQLLGLLLIKGSAGVLEHCSLLLKLIPGKCFAGRRQLPFSVAKSTIMRTGSQIRRLGPAPWFFPGFPPPPEQSFGPPPLAG